MSLSSAPSPRVSRKSRGGSLRRLSSSLEPTLLEKRISDAFDVFDNARSHEVDVRELGTIIRSLGCVISEAELQEIQVEVEDVENNCVTQERFVEYMSKAIREQKFKPAEPEDLLRAFQIFDPENRGHIMRADLEKAMIEVGEPFSQEEIKEMMAFACDPSSSKIIYEHYINALIIEFPDEENVYKISKKIEASKPVVSPSKKPSFFKDLI